ncbi:MAG: glutamate--tRNA ligase [Pirellulales bacterium]
MVRTRFAPSPTGYLHIGGVRTALFNWLFTRHQGGQFILRIDDTDQQRNVEAALAPILEGFRWLGIDWDEGPEVGGPHAPYYQSQRQDRYQAAVEKLIAADRGYYDYATTEEIQAERAAAEREKRSFVYSRRWKAESAADRARFEAQGRSGVVRLKMFREGTLALDDLVRGRVEFQWAQEQDHVIQRADGSCLYHLASVVDDFDFEITHVIRAEEHLSNTPRQVFIAQALGYPLPQFAHLPYVAEPASRTKLSKRKLDKYLKNPDFARIYQHGCEVARRIGLAVAPETFNPVIVDFYREVGYLPDALVNYLALLGWSLDDRTDDFTREELVRLFSLDRVNKAPASFDATKLWAFQDRRMARLPLEERVALCVPFLQRAGILPDIPSPDQVERVTRIVSAAADRIKTAGDVLDYTDFFVRDSELTYDEPALEKQRQKAPEALQLLSKFRQQLASVEPFQPEPLETLLKNFVAAEGVKIGQIVHPLRLALTGKTVGFGLFETLAILGRESSLARIDRVLK